MYNPQSLKAEEFINHQEILDTLTYSEEHKNNITLIKSIIEKAKENNAELIVLGLPKNMDGSEGFRAEACKEFASMLSEKSGLEVNLYDERLTTVSAHNALNATNTRGKKRKAVVDAVSAVMILESYMKSKH